MMIILHISDLHFRISYNNPKNEYEHMLQKMQNPLVPLEFCLKRAMVHTQIDFLAVTGDLTDDGTVADYHYLKHRILQLTGGKIPLLVTLGNHDQKSAFREGWLKEAPSSNPYNTIHVTKQAAFVSFDSSEAGNSRGIISQDQLCWLGQVLKSLIPKPVILLTHHHLNEHQSDMPTVEHKKEFLDLLRQYPVTCILNGHTHLHSHGIVNGVPYYTSDGMSFYGVNMDDGAVRFEEQFGYSLYETDGIKFTEIKRETFSKEKTLATIRWD